jgi:hypothetical protein
MKTSSIVALATMDGRVYGYGLDVCELLRIQQLGQRTSRGWTEAREFIPRTMKIFDRRGW